MKGWLLNMEQFNKLENKLKQAKSELNVQLSDINDRAIILMRKHLKTKQNLVKEMISSVENSKDLTQSYEYYQQFVRVDFSKLIDLESDLQKEALSDIFSEGYGLIVDYQNDCLLMDIGPAILINHEGDVLDQDSGKWIISKNDYETEEQRNELIESYMNKSGYFPAIIKIDYHGNANYVNTQNLSKS